MKSGRAWPVILSVSLLACVVAMACGDSAEEKLFGSGGAAGADASTGGGAAGGSGGGTAGVSGSPSGGAPSGGGAPGGAAGSGGNAAGGSSASGGTAGGGGATSGGGSPSGGSPGGGGGPGGGGAPSGGGAPGGGGAASGGTSGTASLCAGHCGEAYTPPEANCSCNGDCTLTKCCNDFTSVCEPNAISCGYQQLCKLAAGEFCCALKPSTGTQWLTECLLPTETCYYPGVKMYCNGPEDCTGGDVCCGTLNANLTQFTTTKCESPSSCQYSAGKRVMCFLNPGACPSGYVCKAWSAPPIISYCGVP